MLLILRVTNALKAFEMRSAKIQSRYSITNPQTKVKETDGARS